MSLFKAWPKIPRYDNEKYHVTEKIDGTNACIIITDSGEIAAQSRTRIITPEDDNFGFAKWVIKNKDALIGELGVGYHFGEWWGQGIQRGYDLQEKRFSLFNPRKHCSVCYNVPYIGQYTDVATARKEAYDILQEGSLAAPGFKRTEGIVIYAERAESYYKIIWDK